MIDINHACTTICAKKKKQQQHYVQMIIIYSKATFINNWLNNNEVIQHDWHQSYLISVMSVQIFAQTFLK